MRSRFSGHPYAGGLFVLDTWTGEVVKVPEDGSAPVLLRAAVVAPAGSLPASATPPGVVDAGRGPTESVGAPSASQGWTALDREVVNAFPYPIARTYREYLCEADPRQRCKLLVDTFTHVLKLWALLTASEYLWADGVEDISVGHTLSRDFQRPLISAWNLMLARCLPVLAEHQVAPFAPELARAYRELESHCRDKVTIETPYKDTSGAIKVRTSKLGRIQALIRYRNGLAHGYNQSRDKAQCDLERFAPVLESVLDKARFCTRYPLFYAPSAAARGGALEAYRLMGAEPAASLERVVVGQEHEIPQDRRGLFVYDPGRQRALGLGVFFDVEDLSAAGSALAQNETATETEAEAVAGLGWDVLTFEGHTRTTMIYASVTGQLVEKQGRLDEWRALLENKAVPGKAQTLNALTWAALSAAAQRVSDDALHTLRQSGRYIPEVTIARPSFERLVDDFERSDYRAFVVAGDNGMGKSTALARYAETRRQMGDLVLLYRAAALRDGGLQERILRDLGVRDAFFEDFLAALQAVVPEGARVRLVVDSLHEHPSATHELTRAIDALVKQASSYPFLRVMVSIRSAAYERLPPDARFGLLAPDGYFTVEEHKDASTRRTMLIDMPLMTSAQVAACYERYREYARPENDELNPGVHVFRPITPFSELADDGATVALMGVPLFLRLLTAAFAHKPLPANLSFDQAMEPYMEYVVVERDEPGGGYPERRRFLQTLVKLLDEESAASVPRDRLYQVANLAAHLTNPQKDSAYVQLLELGILFEDWDDDQCTVRFAFDRLFEYLLAELHYPRIDGPEALLRLVERALAFKSLRAAVIIIMRRAIRTGRHSLVLDACDLCRIDDVAEELAEEIAEEIADRPGDRPDSADDRAPEEDFASSMFVHMMRDLLIDLARFRDPGFDVLCREIAATASRFDVLVMSAAFDTLFTIGEIAAAHRLAQLAAQVADELEDAQLHAGALFRWAQVDEQRGQPKLAFPRLTRAKELALSAGAVLLGLRIDLLFARLLVTTGEPQRAALLYGEAHHGLVQLGELGDASVALRGQASILAKNDDLERAAELGREAIELARKAGDRASVGKALNNLAMVQNRQGDTDGALHSLEQSLAVKEMLGDRASVATTSLNLGVMYQGRGQLAEARERWHGALATFEALEHRRGCGVTLCNLALLAQLEGDHETARPHLERSLELFRASGDSSGMAQSLWLLASLILDRGRPEEARVDEARVDEARVDEARELVTQLEELSDKLGTQSTKLHCAALRARIAARSKKTDIEPEVSELERVSEPLGVANWEVEDGPASAFLDAAQHARRSGHEARADELMARVRELVRDRPFTRAAELLEHPS